MVENIEIKNSHTNAHTHAGEHTSLGATYLEYKDILSKIKERERPSDRSYGNYNILGSGTSIVNKIKRRKEEIENEDLEQNIRLKRYTLFILLGFLAVETIVIFVFSFFQATFIFNFKLEEWSFKLLITATILQITFMIQVAVKHLFPNKA